MDDRSFALIVPKLEREIDIVSKGYAKYGEDFISELRQMCRLACWRKRHSIYRLAGFSPVIRHAAVDYYRSRSKVWNREPYYLGTTEYGQLPTPNLQFDMAIHHFYKSLSQKEQEVLQDLVDGHADKYHRVKIMRLRQKWRKDLEKYYG